MSFKIESKKEINDGFYTKGTVALALVLVAEAIFHHGPKTQVQDAMQNVEQVCVPVGDKQIYCPPTDARANAVALRVLHLTP